MSATVMSLGNYFFLHCHTLPQIKGFLSSYYLIPYICGSQDEIAFGLGDIMAPSVAITTAAIYGWYLIHGGLTWYGT